MSAKPDWRVDRHVLYGIIYTPSAKKVGPVAQLAEQAPLKR
jgi:hypothetical protein